MDLSGKSSPSDISPASALNWARVLLFAKQHGVVAALVLVTAHSLGIFAQAQTTMCGV